MAERVEQNRKLLSRIVGMEQDMCYAWIHLITKRVRNYHSEVNQNPCKLEGYGKKLLGTIAQTSYIEAICTTG